MKKLPVVALLSALISLPSASHGFSLWKTCFELDPSVRKRYKSEIFHKIVDADVVKIWNRSHYSLAIVKCFEGNSRHAFSRYEDGEPLYPDSSVRIQTKSGEVCEGDKVNVYQSECHIISLTKPERLE